MKKNLFSLLFIFILVACSKTEEDPEPNYSSVLTGYANLVETVYADVISTTENLQTTIVAFATTPTEENLEACKQAWLVAREPYGQSEGFRFYGGPIDAEDGPEGLINGWPLDESYIDYVVGNLDAGIISSDTPITIENIANLNEAGSETNISSGYHAIEFLLWGQDLSETGPGERPLSDFTTDENAERRLTYLTLAGELLLDNLNSVADEWETNYRTTFIADDKASIAKIFRGIGTLAKGELAGERMTVALANQDQEDEHSCFSDNTHNDILNNFLSVKNVYLGIYERQNFTADNTVSDIISMEQNQIIVDLLTSTEASIKAIPAPFDQAIVNGDTNGKITESILNLRKLSDALVDAALELDIQVNTDLD